MVSTRIRTGAIEVRHYDAETLKKNEITAFPGETVDEDGYSPLAKRLKRTYIRKGKAPSKTSPGNRVSKQRPYKRNPFGMFPPYSAEEAAEILGNVAQKHVPPDEPEGPHRHMNEFPRLAFGRHEEHGMSKIMRADREIETWEEVRRVHAEKMPQVLPHIDQQLAKARATRESLEDNEENNRIG